ncbi:MAG TPA: universal stress protein [Duganella sp.]|jgi:nucleotide-binding universal stress UspA family protein
MFKTILLPTDGSDLSDKATATAVEFAKLHNARIVGITVIQPLPLSSMGDGGAMIDSGQFAAKMQEAARSYIDKVAAAAHVAGIPFEGVITVSHTPFEEIVEAAKKFDCDIIMMASHGHKGLNKLLLGSQTEKVLAHTTLPVLVLR